MLHFTPRAEWEAATERGEYRPAAMAQEGFVHLSFGHQLAAVASELVPGASDLVVLVVDPGGLEAALRIEGGFPHLYGPVPLESVRLVLDMPPRPDGSFELPEAARLAELVLVSQPSAAAALRRARSVMDGFPGPWWLAGGWALEPAEGEPSRPHLDLDVALLREDASRLASHLHAFDLRRARNGRLLPWEGGRLEGGDHQVWARPRDGTSPQRWQDFAADPGFVEFLFEDLDAEGRFVFRRDGSVRAPIERLGSPGGFLSPEVALLYRAKALLEDDAGRRSTAHFDFEHVLSRLEREQRAWLHDAIGRVHDGHPWLRALSG